MSKATTATTDETTTVTMEALLAVLTECAGDIELPGTADEIPDRSFGDLGCDSLVLLETAARLQSEYGIVIPDDVIAELETPRSLLEFVNGRVGGAVGAPA
ncbi:acyl carrier protein [Streptomyces sp. URMC 123]|uniref:acyl carrier protein n=1 Tax=Streptomyces sp. URMC 123 TaxID=3423403 RepID=UPI003F1BFB7D